MVWSGFFTVLNHHPLGYLSSLNGKKSGVKQNFTFKAIKCALSNGLPNIEIACKRAWTHCTLFSYLEKEWASRMWVKSSICNQKNFMHLYWKWANTFETQIPVQSTHKTIRFWLINISSSSSLTLYRICILNRNIILTTLNSSNHHYTSNYFSK